MKNLYFFIFLIPILFLTIHSKAQEGCLTELGPKEADFMKKLDKQFADFNRNTRSASGCTLDYVPVQLHVVNKSDSSGSVFTDFELAVEIHKANNYFANSNIKFYLCGGLSGINYIYDDDHYNFITSNLQDFTNTYKVENVINIYFVNSLTKNHADGGWSIVAGFATFPGSQNDHIFVVNIAVELGKTLIHELGHYFGLYHTHEGYNGFENVTREPNDTCFNCHQVGDLLCDTAADPDLFGQVDADCYYTGSYVDACSITYEPPISNIMSYSGSNCKYMFTQGQYERMAFYNETARNYLACDAEFPCAESYNFSGNASQGPLKIYVVEDFIESTRNHWPCTDVVYDAGNKIKLEPGFQAQEGAVFETRLEGCSIVFKSEEPDHFMEHLDNISLKVFPNPLSNISSIEYTLPHSSIVKSSIYDLSGKRIVLLEDGVERERGVHTFQFEATAIPNGIYYLEIETDEFRITKKIVVTK